MAALTRLGIIYRAVRDRRQNTPAPAAGRVGHVEQQVVAGVNHAIHEKNERFLAQAAPLRAQLADRQHRVDAELRPEFQRLVAQAGGRTYVTRLLDPAMHAVLFIGITGGELAFNAHAFALFGEATWMTWLVALSIGAALPIAAWLLGTELRQATWTRRRIAGWSAIVAAVVVTLVGVNHIRTVYLQHVQADEQGLTMTAASLSVAYLSMNLFIFIAAAVIAYAGHDPVRRFVAVRAALLREETRILEIEYRLQILTARTQATIDRLACDGLSAILLYRGTNRRGRTTVPTYFDDAAHPDHEPPFATISRERAASASLPTASGAALAPAE